MDNNFPDFYDAKIDQNSYSKKLRGSKFMN